MFNVGHQTQCWDSRCRMCHVPIEGISLKLTGNHWFQQPHIMGIAGGVRNVIQARCFSADAFGQWVGGVDQVLRWIGISIATSTIIERQLAMAVTSLPPPTGPMVTGFSLHHSSPRIISSRCRRRFCELEMSTESSRQSWRLHPENLSPQFVN
jgi:hypothetical protein